MQYQENGRKMNKTTKYRLLIESLLMQYGITATFSGDGDVDDISSNYYWWSDPDELEVCIPPPDSLHRVMVCLHEIGHCVVGRRSITYNEEYRAEIWALKTAKKFGITKTASYEKHAAKLLMRYIKSDIHSGKLKPGKVNKQVIHWIKKRGIKYEV